MIRQHNVCPYLLPRDVLLFGAGVIHFGPTNSCLSKSSSSKQGISGRIQPFLYFNITHAWFHNVNIWNDRESLLLYSLNRERDIGVEEGGVEG